jgi:hypothetical protein
LSAHCAARRLSGGDLFEPLRRLDEPLAPAKVVSQAELSLPRVRRSDAAAAGLLLTREHVRRPAVLSGPTVCGFSSPNASASRMTNRPWRAARRASRDRGSSRGRSPRARRRLFRVSIVSAASVEMHQVQPNECGRLAPRGFSSSVEARRDVRQARQAGGLAFYGLPPALARDGYVETPHGRRAGTQKRRPDERGCVAASTFGLHSRASIVTIAERVRLSL